MTDDVPDVASAAQVAAIERQVNFLERHHASPPALPDDWRSNRSSASEALRRLINVKIPPSGKQLSLARALAEEKSVELPSEAEISFSACKMFIDRLLKRTDRNGEK